MALLALAVGVGRGQEPIRVKVNLVSVAFVARDANGALVNNLTQDDVEVLEDAIPQKVAFFSRSADVPFTLGLVVDASGSQDHFSKQHKNDLEVFFKDVLGPKDRVFLVGIWEPYPVGERFLAVGRGPAGTVEAVPEVDGKISGARSSRGPRSGDGVL